MRKTAVQARKAAEPLALLAVAVMALALLPVVRPAVVRADTLSEKQEKAKQVKAQLQANQAELDRLTAALNQTQSQLALVEASIERNQAELEEAEAKLDAYKGILSRRIKAMYMEGSSTTLEVILDTESFGDFLNSYDFMRMIGNYDADMVEGARELLSTIREKRAALESSRARHQEQAAALARQRGAIQAKLAEQKSILSSLDAEIASLVQQQMAASRPAARSGGSSSGGSSGGSSWVVGPVDGLYFPVAGPCSFTNDWGAPRSGGRTHKGCDIMANYGTPCVAITSGTVVQRSGGNAGLYIFLYGDNGHLYYYMHLQGYAASGRVAAGQVIGYVGDTGNARGCPHLHFEFHPNGGAAVNPYPLLKAIYGR